MSKRLLSANAEILLPEDFDDLTKFQQEAVDNLVNDAVGYPANWAGFTVSAANNAQVVNISRGRYYAGRLVYEAENSTPLNLQLYLPTVASDERWVALILRGNVEEDAAMRSFKDLAADADDNAIVMRSTPHVEARRISFVVQQGLISPPPAVVPTVAETDCCIALVRLTASGVQEIVSNDSDRVKSIFELEGRMVGVEVNLSALSLRTTTLETDLTNTNAAVNDLRSSMLRPAIARQMRRDIAALRRGANVPAGARSDWYDPGLLMDQWDATHAQWRARVDEGVQFPFAFEREARLNVIAEDDPRIRFTGRRMMPAWTEVVRVSNWQGTATRDISQAVHSEIVAKKREVSRSSIKYGPTVTICENAAEWSRYAQALHAGASFQKNGELWVTEGMLYAQANYGPGHAVFAVKQVKIENWTEVFWDYVTQEVGVNGSVFGQTMLISQPTIATSVDLDFSRVGADGDVHLFICETDPTGAPLVEKVLARMTLPFAQLRLGANSFAFEPTYLTPGGRYAWFAVTVGNHQLRGSTGNAYAGGTSFRLTDGVWAQGDLDFDFKFRLNAARFSNTRTVVQFQPMSLENGMSEVRLLYANWHPDGTAIEWEIRVSGQEKWYRLEATDENPLNGLPSLVELRATFLSTPDLAPMIVMDEFAVYKASRRASEMRAISKAIDFGLTTSSVQTLTVLDEFDPDVHTFTPRILVGASASLVAPSVSTVTIDPDRPERREVLSTYTVPAGTQIVRNAPGMTTNNIVDVAFIENTALFAL